LKTSSGKRSPTRKSSPRTWASRFSSPDEKDAASMTTSTVDSVTGSATVTVPERS
jgi:hypothetical protein